MIVLDLITFLNSSDALDLPVEASADAVVATDKPAEEAAAAEPPKTDEADVKPTEEVAAPSTDKDAAVQEEKKAGFLTSLRKGLNVALVPKPSLDNATEGKKRKEEAAQAETTTVAAETPAEVTVDSADVTPYEPAPAPAATEATAPPVRRTSFAAFKHRVAHGFATPIGSPSATPTKKGATGTVASLTASPPASPPKTTLHDLAESAATKLEETANHLKHNNETAADSPNDDDAAVKAPATTHKKVDQFKGLGKKFEEAFHKKSSASKPAATEPEAAVSEESTEATPAVAAAADVEATDKATETAASENVEAPPTAPSKKDGAAKPERRFLNLKKRFSISVQSKGGDKSAATSSDEGKDAAVVAKEGSPIEPVAETAADDATPSDSETTVHDAPKEAAPVAQRKTSIFSALVNGKGSSKTATSPAAVPKADPLETALEASTTQEAEAEVTPAEAAAPATPETPAKETESAPASPAKTSGKKGMAPSSFGLEKLNKMANKIFDKSKDEAKSSKNRLSMDFHRAKKDKEAEASPVAATEQVEDKTEAPAAAAEESVAAPALALEDVTAPAVIVEAEAAKAAETKVEEKAEEKAEPVAAAPAAAAEVKVDAEEKKE